MRFKAHNGTDYAAPHGTPIKTTASGVVERTGYTCGKWKFCKKFVIAQLTLPNIYTCLKFWFQKRTTRFQGQMIG